MHRGADQTLVRLDGGGPTGVRFPDGLRDRLKAAAAANKRSMNAEIIHRLEVSLGAGDACALDSQIATLIQKHVDAEVQRRLREIASRIGGAK